MIAMVEKKTFSRRAFVSISLLASGLVLPVSGLIIHKLGFQELTVARHFWMSVHNMAGFLFTFFAICHVVINRRALGNYLKKRPKPLFSREAAVALAMVIGVIGLFASHAFLVR
jgi:hypothetical protein